MCEEVRVTVVAPLPWKVSASMFWSVAPVKLALPVTRNVSVLAPPS